jgi:SAM-dependent methyltransferase
VPYYKPLLSPVARATRRVWFRWKYSGSGVTCPVCKGEFKSYVGGETGHCPGCETRDRCRLMWLFLRDQRPELLGDSKAILQIAPDPGLERLFRNMQGIRYLSGDLHEPEALVRLDLTALDLPDMCFDLVICIHVLAHISNDRKAMREIHRVLRPGGIALIMTPLAIDRDETYEDPCIIGPDARDKAYGEWDFVRIYGRDLEERLKEANFNVEQLCPADNLSDDQRRVHGVWNDRIFFCSTNQR